MGINTLYNTLKSDTKTGHLFDANGTFVAYKTGIPVLDYNLGCTVNIYEKNEIIDSYAALGITSGSIVEFIGKSHSGKTTLAIQIAANIVRPFPNGIVMHYDLEGGTNYTRISAISKFTPSEMEDGKYVLRQSNSSIQEIKKTIAQIYKEKTEHPEIYKYNTGKVNEFGKVIEAFEPTVMIIDSVPSMHSFINENTKDGQATLDEISSQTDKMRLTAEIGRFLSESLEMLKTANIMLFLINHIKARPGMGVPMAPELPYLKQDESLPAGKAVQYYTNTLIRLTPIGSEKFTLEEDGFEGYGATAQFIKNRTNTNGTIVNLIFDKVHGYDSLRSSVRFAKDNGLLGGNRNGYYFINNKESKFTGIDMHKDFSENRELYKIMYAHIIPLLEKSLSTVKPEEMQIIDEEMDY